MPATQRRRRPVADDEDDDATPPRARGRNGERDSDDDVDEDGDEDMEGGADGDENAELVKKMVRYAIACDFSRTPIRREGIKERVLGNRGRAFKKVFDGAQKQLMRTFGMRMVELPVKDKTAMSADQRRKAAKTNKSQSHSQGSSNAYMLVSILHDDYRKPEIIPPSKVTSPDGEASYAALYTIIISIIMLSGGELSDPRLRRYLHRLRIGDMMPSLNPGAHNSDVEKTDIVLQRMIRQNYLIRVVESRVAGDEEATTWHVGPRGKTEVTNEDVARVIRKVFKGSTDELEKQMQNSLKIKEAKVPKPESDSDEDEDGAENGDPGPSSRRSARNRRAQAAEEEEEEEEEDEDDE